jgi:hypothetical protein
LCDSSFTTRSIPFYATDRSGEGCDLHEDFVSAAEDFVAESEGLITEDERS